MIRHGRKIKVHFWKQFVKALSPCDELKEKAHSRRVPKSRRERTEHTAPVLESQVWKSEKSAVCKKIPVHHPPHMRGSWTRNIIQVVAAGLHIPTLAGIPQMQAYQIGLADTKPLAPGILYHLFQGKGKLFEADYFSVSIGRLSSWK